MICFVICTKEFLQGNCLLSSQTLCCLILIGTKLCLYSSSQNCFNLQSSPHILFLVCSAFPGKLHPHFQLITTLTHSLISPVPPLPAWQHLLFHWPPALQAGIDCTWLCLCWQWQSRTSGVKQPHLLAMKHSMIVGTVLFQSSSYGKEGKLLCCLGKEASEPGMNFTGMMLRNVMLCCPFPLFLQVFQEGCGSSQIYLCLVV